MNDYMFLIENAAIYEEQLALQNEVNEEILYGYDEDDE